MPPWLPLIASGLVFAVLLMAGVWALAVRIRNAGIVDIAWTASFVPLALLYASSGGGAPARAWLVAGMACLWSVRLASYLCVRVAGHHPVEDSRYADLRRDWAPNANRRFFWFFQAQALAAVAFSLPFAITASDPDPTLGWLEWLGVAVWAAGFVGESMADLQLARFKRDPASRGRVCRDGLWNHSRHPNYFFEWLVWCGYALVAQASPWGWLALACPAAMLYLLLRVTGIPALERAAVDRRGDAYRDYQRTTSAFVPWFKRA
jgi:steroid 5-alpha reductase family enzyme